VKPISEAASHERYNGLTDRDVEGWLGAALRRGDQETLDASAEVLPLTGRPLDAFWNRLSKIG